MIRTVILGVLASLSSIAMAQETPAVATLPDAGSTDDIIVQALRIPRSELPTGVYWNYPSILNSRIRRESAQMFFHCALGFGNTQFVRNVVDGEPNSATARISQSRIIETHKGCYPLDGSAGIIVSNNPFTPDAYQSHIDRGVIVESVLNAYAPDAALTPAITGDATVVRRFRQREGVRNRYRLPVDRDALRFSSCLVEDQPVLATRFIRSKPGIELEQGLLQTLIVEGRSCIGGAKRVTIDPTLARSFIADAFYRWVVAARNVESLIPAET